MKSVLFGVAIVVLGSTLALFGSLFSQQGLQTGLLVVAGFVLGVECLVMLIVWRALSKVGALLGQPVTMMGGRRRRVGGVFGLELDGDGADGDGADTDGVDADGGWFDPNAAHLHGHHESSGYTENPSAHDFSNNDTSSGFDSSPTSFDSPSSSNNDW